MGFLSGVLSPISGLMGGLGDSAPDAPGKTPLDAGTQKLVDQQSEIAGKDPSYFSGILNRGVQGVQTGLGQTGNQLQQENASQGGQNSNINAIHNAYNAQAQQGINQIMNKNEMQGNMMKADYMNQLSKTLLGQQAQAVQQQQFLTNVFSQQEQARAQAINSLFQVGDQIIGMNARMKAAQTSTRALAGGAPMPVQDNQMNNYGQYGGLQEV